MDWVGVETQAGTNALLKRKAQGGYRNGDSRADISIWTTLRGRGRGRDRLFLHRSLSPNFPVC
jgi:hypothetical protein